MGFLTTFTVYNDGCEEIKKHPEEFARNCYKACLSNKTDFFGVGCHCNLIKHQKTRHADDKTVYVHAGNTLCEMNVYSSETLEIMKNNPEFFQEMLKVLTLQVKELKIKFKEIQK